MYIHLCKKNGKKKGFVFYVHKIFLTVSKKLQKNIKIGLPFFFIEKVSPSSIIIQYNITIKVKCI